MSKKGKPAGVGMTPSETELGRFLRRCRLKLGLRQSQVAGLAGIKQNEYSNLETGKFKYLKSKQIEDLAKVLKCDQSELKAVAPLKDESKTELAKLIHSRREQLGLTLEDFAERMGVSLAYAKNYLEGRCQTIGYSSLKSLAKVLKFKKAYLSKFLGYPGKQTKSVFGQLVRSGRKKRGISAVELSEELGVEREFISQIELGKYKPRWDNDIIKWLAEALDLDVSELQAAAKQEEELEQGLTETGVDQPEEGRVSVMEMATAEDRGAPIGSIQRIPRNKIRRYEGQPRTWFDPEKLAELAASIEEIGQRTPILVKRVFGDPEHDYELMDGERRWLACGIAGIETMDALVKQPKDSDEQFLISVVANFGGEDHTPLETAKAIDRLRNTKWMQRFSASERVVRIAKICAKSNTWVYQHLALLRLDPKVQEMMAPEIPKSERLDHSVALYISSLYPELQVEIAQEVVQKELKVTEARFYARKVAERLGMQPGIAKKSRKPSEDYRILRRFTANLQKESKMFLEMSRDHIESIFKMRALSQRIELAQGIKQGIIQLNKLLSVLLEGQVLAKGGDQLESTQ